MKIDELINELERVKEEHGNLMIISYEGGPGLFKVLNSFEVTEKDRLREGVPDRKVVCLNL